MKKNNVLRKVLAVSLSAAMLLGTGFTTAGGFIGIDGISANAEGTTIVKSGLCGNKLNYTLDTDGTLTIFGTGDMIDDNQFVDDWSIKNIIIKDGVTSISYGAFQSCGELISVTIPDSVIKIEGHAFAYCENLQNAVMPKTVTELGEGAFADCNNLKSIIIPQGLEKISDDTFSGCSSLTSITIPYGIKTIGRSAFSSCSSLQNINIPDSVTYIGYYAFSHCTNLPSIDIPGSVKEIGDCAFYQCENLTNVILGDGIEVLGMQSFNYCLNLKELTIPKSVREIQGQAFGYKAYSRIYGVVIKGYTGTVAEDYATSSNIIFIELEEPKALENNSSISHSKINTNETATIYASADGGEGNYQYEIIYKLFSDLDWNILQNYSTNTSVSFTTSKDGIYNIRVNVKDGANTIVSKDFALEVETNELENISAISADSIKLGEFLNIMCAAKGGTAPYKYQVLYKQKTSDKWSSAQSYSTNSSVSIKPSQSVKYEICVKVKDSTNTEVKKYFEVTVTDNRLKNISTLSASSIELGKMVTVNAAASGSTGFYQYAVYTKKNYETKWSCKQSFDSNTIVPVKPNQATSYDVCVKVKDNKGTVVKKYFVLEVTEKVTELSNNSTISDTEINLGEELTVSASANGSTGFYKYAVSYKGANDTSWTTVQHYSSKSVVTIKPLITGDYSICVSVKDNLDNTAEKYFTVLITA